VHIRSQLPTVLVACCLTTVPAFAQDSDRSNEDIADLSLEEAMNINIEVTSVSKKSENLATTNAATHVITSEDIRRSGALSIPEALRMAPGLQVARLSSSAYAISSRGFNGEFEDKMLALIDGRTVDTPLFSGVFWNIQDLPLDDIAQIAVIRGPGGALWRANAVNGVINLITKSAEETQGSSLTAIVGTEERGSLLFRHGGKLSDSGQYRACAKYFDRDKLDNPGTGPGDDGNMSRAGFRTDWTSDEGDSPTVQGDTYRSNEHGIMLEGAFIPDMGSGFDTLVALFGSEDFESEEVLARELSYRIQLSESLSLNFPAFINDHENLATQEFGAITPIGAGTLLQPVCFDNKFSGHTYGVQTAGQWVVPENLQVHAGYAYIEMDLEVDSDSNDIVTGPHDVTLRHQAHMHSDYDLSETIEFDGSVCYVDDLSIYADSYVRGDVHLGWRPNADTRISLAYQGLLHDEEEEFGDGPFGASYYVESSVYVMATWSF
jgi:outer membrane receptor for ferrienterochelin and colicin